MKDKTIKISITIGENFLKEVDDFCEYELRSRSSLISIALKEYMEKHKNG